MPDDDLGPMPESTTEEPELVPGGVDAIAANSWGSAAAIASGSNVPRRSRTLAGPRKACSIGYC